MNELFIYYFRENNGEGEYVVFSEDNLSAEMAAEHELLGYHFEEKITLSTTDKTYKLPFDTVMLKSN